MDSTDFRTTAAPLPTPRFPDAADGGLGYDDILRIPDRNLLVLVGPWDGFEDGDTVQILVGPDQRIFGSAPASAADKDKSIDVFVPARNFSLLADGVHDTFARVINSLGLPVSSVAAPIRLKLAVPGGPDPVADTPYRNENLGPPIVLPAVIGPGTATATVTMPPWDNMAEGDRLILRWGVAGNELAHDVAATEVGQAIELTVDRAMLDRGGFGSGVNVNYQVFDLVENWSLWSPPDLVDVEDPDALDPPWVTPTVDEEGRIIDLDALGGRDVTAEVFGLRQGDIAVVRFDGLTAEGSATEHVTPPQTASVAGRPLYFALPHALFPPLAQGMCAVGYTVQRTGENVPASARRRLDVRGQLQQLDPPEMEEAVGDILDPADVPNGATARIVANPLIAVDTRVTLTMHGTSTGGIPVGHEVVRDISASTPFPLRLIIPGEKIAALRASTASFEYTVDTFDAVLGRRVRHPFRPNALYPSPVRTYRIAGLAQGLPPPEVPKADGDTLDPDLIDEREGVQVDVTWDFIALNDRVTLTWDGPGSATYTDSLIVHGTRVTFFVPKVPYVTSNIGNDISVAYTAAFAAGGSDRSAPRVLHIGATEALTIDGPATVNVSGTFQCTASGGRPPYTFQSSDASVATIDNQGSGQGIKAGNATLTVTDAASSTADHALQVVAALTISGPPTVDTGASFRCTAGGGVPPYAFRTSNTNIATIDNNGDGRGVNAGNVDITVTDSLSATASRSLQVIARLTIDTSPVTLSGESFAWNATERGLSPIPYTGTFVDRPASGGTPPYTYTSSNPDLVRVEANNRVRARRNGTATISVRDSAGQTVSFSVTVTNAWIMEYIGDFIWNGAMQYQRPGGHLPTGDEMNWRIRPNWRDAWPLPQDAFWTSDQNGASALLVSVSSGGAVFVLKAFSYSALSVYR